VGNCKFPTNSPGWHIRGSGNQEREINGLLAALKFFNLSEGIILTIDQTDKILIDRYKINVVPCIPIC
jgi:hypothetical protein